MPNIELTLLVGQYAQAFYLGARREKTLTETVRNWQAYLPDFIPTPHPSWRSTNWLKLNSWFDEEVVPDLRRRVARVVGR
jgi:uracil-DNA glycosylase